MKNNDNGKEDGKLASYHFPLPYVFCAVFDSKMANVVGISAGQPRLRFIHGLRCNEQGVFLKRILDLASLVMHIGEFFCDFMWFFFQIF